MERIDVVATLAVLDNAERFLLHLSAVQAPDSPTAYLWRKVQDEHERLRTLYHNSPPGPVETFRNAHPRTVRQVWEWCPILGAFDAIDCIYWGCTAEPPCDWHDPEVAEAHRRAWADRPAKEAP